MLVVNSDTSPGIALLLTVDLSTLLARPAIAVARLATSPAIAARPRLTATELSQLPLSKPQFQHPLLLRR